jgi:hypothetical protein
MLEPIFRLLDVKEEDWSEVTVLRHDKCVISFTFKHRGHGLRYVKALLTGGEWKIVLDRPR